VASAEAGVAQQGQAVSVMGINHMLFGP